MDNYYEILNITNEADLKEIKKAYAKLIRQYPPENFSEEFKKIRKAYEVLSNSELRKLYDNSNCENEYIYVDDVNSGNGTDNDNDCNSEYEADYDDNYENEENYLVITPKSDFRDIMRVYLFYFNNKNYSDAEKTLNAAIDLRSINNSNNIMCYLELLELYIFNRDMDAFIIKLDELFEAISLEDKKDTKIEYLYENLIRLSEKLLKSRKILYWLIVKNKMTYMETGAEEDVYELINEYKSLYNQYSKDYKNSASFRILLEIWFENSMSDGERGHKLWETENGIYKSDLSKILDSIKRLKKKYNKLYEVDSQYFQAMYNNIKKTYKVDVGDSKFYSKLIFGSILVTICHPLIFGVPILFLYYLLKKCLNKR